MIVKKDSLKKEELFKNYDDDKSAASLSVNSVYINIDEKSTLERIKEDLKEVAGIYAIVHNETKKFYIGSSMNLAKRILEHIKNISSNIHLQRAISKYGLNNFSIYRCLRCTLTGFERNYQVKIPSKQINKPLSLCGVRIRGRSYTTLTVEQTQAELKMDP